MREVGVASTHWSFGVDRNRKVHTRDRSLPWSYQRHVIDRALWVEDKVQLKKEWMENRISALRKPPILATVLNPTFTDSITTEPCF